MRAKVYVTLKKGVLDPQGKAVMGAGSIGFDEVKDVRVGKFMEVELTGLAGSRREEAPRDMREAPANTVIENYRIERGNLSLRKV
ncbi:MAG: phosphoribosylformylglycinamidine synthase subunit PurS [Deltaproteobacteria bacterium]|nr:phosphoribosylformylglycinamidine synthase subunit PurS [Deltaproteobacteria bacterium]